MKQPIKIKNKSSIIQSSVNKHTKQRHKHKKYGTSQLERDFAKLFLDNLGLQYIYQYEVKQIGRFYDFAVTTASDKEYIFEEKDGLQCIKQENQYFEPSLLIEIDGDYYHSNPKLYKNKDLNPLQKHNKFIDRLKDEWAGMHCIPLLRIWEYDIRNNPEFVKKQILQYVSISKKKKNKINDRKIPH